MHPSEATISGNCEPTRPPARRDNLLWAARCDNKLLAARWSIILFGKEDPEMNLLAAIIVIGAYLIGLVSAEDTLVEGGRSPDGLSEVRLVRAEGYDPNKDGSEYSPNILTNHI
jgi:hypothetical protein